MRCCAWYASPPLRSRGGFCANSPKVVGLIGRGVLRPLPSHFTTYPPHVLDKRSKILHAASDDGRLRYPSFFKRFEHGWVLSGWRHSSSCRLGLIGRWGFSDRSFLSFFHAASFLLIAVLFFHAEGPVRGGSFVLFQRVLVDIST